MSEERVAIVRALSARASRGRLFYGPLVFPCALGRAGRRARKREGDGASPIGTWPIVQIFYRADRVARPRTRLEVPIRPLDPRDAWCDRVGDRNYNRLVRLPYPGLDESEERLWRADHLYDICVVLGHNRRPRVQGLGSAIFMHVARAGFEPTAGCVALGLGDLVKLLEAPQPPIAIRFAG